MFDEIWIVVGTIVIRQKSGEKRESEDISLIGVHSFTQKFLFPPDFGANMHAGFQEVSW